MAWPVTPAALCPPRAGEQVNASLQVLAEVRRAPAHSAVLLPRRLSSWDFKVSGKQGLVLTRAPHGPGGRKIPSSFPKGACMVEGALAREPRGLVTSCSHLLTLSGFQFSQL